MKSNGYNFFYDKKEKLFVITSTPSDSFRYLEALKDIIFPKETQKRIIYFVACYLLELEQNEIFSASPTEEKISHLKKIYDVQVSLNTLKKYENLLKEKNIIKLSKSKKKNVWKSWKADTIEEELPEVQQEAETELYFREEARRSNNEKISEINKDILRLSDALPEKPELKNYIKQLENRREYLMRTTPFMETKRVYVCKNFEISENEKVKEYFTDKMENYKKIPMKKASKVTWEKYHFLMKTYTALEINYNHPDIKKILEFSHKIVEERKGINND